MDRSTCNSDTRNMEQYINEINPLNINDGNESDSDEPAAEVDVI